MVSLVTLYGNSDSERAATITLDVRSLDHAREVIPQCVARHRGRTVHDCQLTKWTISIVDPSTHLFTIAAQGVIDETEDRRQPSTDDGVADRVGARHAAN